MLTDNETEEKRVYFIVRKIKKDVNQIVLLLLQRTLPVAKYVTELRYNSSKGPEMI